MVFSYWNKRENNDHDNPRDDCFDTIFACKSTHQQFYFCSNAVRRVYWFMIVFAVDSVNSNIEYEITMRLKKQCVFLNMQFANGTFIVIRHSKHRLGPSFDEQLKDQMHQLLWWSNSWWFLMGSLLYYWII